MVAARKKRDHDLDRIAKEKDPRHPCESLGEEEVVVDSENGGEVNISVQDMITHLLLWIDDNGPHMVSDCCILIPARITLSLIEYYRGNDVYMGDKSRLKLEEKARVRHRIAIGIHDETVRCVKRGVG